MDKLEKLERTEFVYGLFDNRSDPEATDREWGKISNIRLGLIALPDSYVEEKGLHKAQRSPWDDSKDIPFTLVSLEDSLSSRSLLIRRNVSELAREESGEDKYLIVRSAIAASTLRLAVIMAITSGKFDYIKDEDCMPAPVSLA
ncbi:hypothetical protein BPAE_0156g00080 [Botrytis paeoniae]|uniref:Uncharacterized protein n=1 Tax=Botrytis paeoniae TaxID=278948 RepID=A0A4Z1FE54_9HELO|nr:hypothetical protein BPAE_0156g00080 [Botrytis paeoniae]